ncbi:MULTISPECIES: DUF2510 domain-containing protein [unclassified Streptomyces]|uniref:DUF2510 domain-containing protein n=1 Tax=unclassified Streptomyces TaxID=2593676 RepID=UPI0004BFDFD2|nr:MULTISPECIES: DUF2510 domain-containing protein [unclassified Streptomyces]
MSSPPPPGWYRDPSYPLVERWWDGTAWTDHRRTPEGRQPQPPGVPDGGPVSASRRGRVVALVAAGAVLVVCLVTGVLVLGRDGGDSGDGDGGRAGATASDPGSPAAAPGKSTGPGAPSPSATADPSVVVDDLNGITFPVLDGWTRPEDVAEDDIVLTTPGSYSCPGDSIGVCRHGRVLSRTARAGDDSTPETLAKGDIQDAADAEYDRDGAGDRPYGGVTSHRLVGQGQIAVAGRAGYYVRWRVTTAKGPGGYVESLAFPSSTGSQAPVLVRFAFDAGTDGPPLADMDRITRGIRPVGDAAGDGGVGSSIGPGA